MSPRHPLALGFLLLTILVTIGVFARQRQSTERAMSELQPTPIHGHLPDGDTLAARMHLKDQEIAALREQVGRLEQELTLARSSRQAAIDAEGTQPRDDSPSSTDEDLERGFPGALARVRGRLPEKYAKLSLAELEMLTELELGGEQVTDETLVELAALTHLRNLSLRGSAISDAGLANLGEQLESLTLRGTQVSGIGLANLRTTNLEALHLCGTQVSGEDLYRLPPMPQLKTMKLNFLDVDDRAIEQIANYPSVRHLELDQTQVSDVGLWRLMSLNPRLERIELRGTQVTQAAALEVAKQYPNCTLVLDSGHFAQSH